MHSSRIQGERFFAIESDRDFVNIREVGNEEFYSGRGYYRTALVPTNMPDLPNGRIHQDRDAALNVSSIRDHQGRNYKVRRLYQIYDQQMPLFPRDKRSSFIEELEIYPTFLTESGLIDRDYIQSLFFTQTLNKEGYYKYFVKRNGRYYVETVDDQIPVDSFRQFPIWGLDIQYPWQIILLKAWIKEKGSLEGVINAQPFEFLHAFGLPSYKVSNFKKELAFIASERVSEEERSRKFAQLKLNRDNLIIIAKSRDSARLNEMGLTRNRAAYLVTPVQKNNNQAQLFRVTSSVPQRWVGEMSVIADSKVNSRYDPRKHGLNLERSFLITRFDLLELFNKFYIAPAQGFFADKSSVYYTIPLDNVRSHQVELIVHSEGRASIVIELPEESRKVLQIGKVRYPKIKYFLSKVRDSNAPKRSHIASHAQLKSRLNLVDQDYIQSAIDKYEYYDIEYGLGYHKSINQFIFLQPGVYMMHIKVEKTPRPIYCQLAINTTAKIQTLREAQLTQPDKNSLFSSTFYGLGLTHGTEVAITDNLHLESIKIGNLFYQIGYGFIVISTMKDAKHHLAMRVFPRKLREAGYAFKCGYKGKEVVEEHNKGLEKPIVLISQRGHPEIIVLRMISKVPLHQRFPPKGSVQFYRITDQ